MNKSQGNGGKENGLHLGLRPAVSRNRDGCKVQIVGGKECLDDRPAVSAMGKKQRGINEEFGDVDQKGKR